MSKINNNLIGIFAVLAFVLGPIGASSAFARTVYVRTGAVFYPTIYPTTTTETTTTTNNATQTTDQNTNGSSTNSNTESNTTTTNTNSTTNNKVNDNSNTESVLGYTASDINTEYGKLTASAVTGSNGFWPTGIAQWILLFIILIIIITLFRYVRRSKEIYMTSPAKHA